MNQAIDHTLWSYDPATRIVTAGAVACNGCRYNQAAVPAGRRMVFPWVACVKCRGTGKRGNGKCRACAYHRDKWTRGSGTGGYEPGMVPDYGNPQDGGPCPHCEGTGSTDAHRWGTGNADLPEHIRTAILDSLPVELAATDVRHTWAESHLGMTRVDTDGLTAYALWVTEDYGRTWERLAAAHAAGTFGTCASEIRAEVTEGVREHVRRIIDIARVPVVDRPDSYRVADRVVALCSPSGIRVLAVTHKPA